MALSKAGPSRSGRSALIFVVVLPAVLSLGNRQARAEASAAFPEPGDEPEESGRSEAALRPPPPAPRPDEPARPSPGSPSPARPSQPSSDSASTTGTAPSESRPPSSPAPPATSDTDAEGSGTEERLYEHRSPSGSEPPAPASPGGGLAFRPVALPSYGNYEPPPGYETVSRPNWVLAGGGLGVFVLSYGASVVYAAANDFSEGLGMVGVPVLGPWLAIGARDFSCQIQASTSSAELCQQATIDDATAVAVLAGLGITQLAGAALTTLGLFDRDVKWVRSDLVELRLDVQAAPGLAGLRVGGVF